MLREIAGHVVLGGICFLVLLVLALARHEALRALVWDDPLLAVVLGIAAALTFAPIVICVAVGSVARGEQDMSPGDD